MVLSCKYVICRIFGFVFVALGALVINIRYRPEVDGLRAIAILPVILFHFNHAFMPGGYAGVDVFFVISGFLITALILGDVEAGKFSFMSFWWRRFLRIFPALSAMVLVTLLVGSVAFYAADLPSLGSNGLASLLSFSNVSHWLVAGDYWGSGAESSPLLHTWSLSVEEQFYLLFPLLLVLLGRYLPAWVRIIITVLVLLSLMLFIVGVHKAPSATFYLLPTRAWELGVGALVAFAVRHNKMQFASHQALTVLGLLLIIFSYIFLGGGSGVSPWLPLPVLGAALIIACSNGTGNIVGSFLSLPPMVYIGKISYSLYLWHWPILVVAKQLEMKKSWLPSEISLFCIIGLVSALSYHFIEVPTRRNNKAMPYVLGVILAGGALAFALREVDSSEDISAYNTVEWKGSSYNVAPNSAWPESVRKRMAGVKNNSEVTIPQNAYMSGGIQKLYGASIPEIVLLGDSHGLMWGGVLDESAKKLGKSIAFLAADATSPFMEIPPVKGIVDGVYFDVAQRLDFDNSRLKVLAAWKPKIVVVAARWSGYELQKTKALIEYLGTVGSHVLIVEQPPELYFGDKNAPQFLSYLGLVPIDGVKQYVNTSTSPDYDRGLSLVRQIVSSCDYCSLVLVSDLFRDGDKALVLDSHDVLYIDDDHLSQAGAQRVQGRIIEALRENP